MERDFSHKKLGLTEGFLAGFMKQRNKNMYANWQIEGR